MGRERYNPQQQLFYKRYLNSTKWRQRKNARIAKAGGRCEFVRTLYEPGVAREVRCTSRRYLCVHHNTYERLGNEEDRDLDVYCWLHHTLEHMLWKKCTYCGGPAIGNDEVGEKWLRAILSTLGIDLDFGPINWKKLPNKEYFLRQIPHCCQSCKQKLLGSNVLEPEKP